MAKEMKILNENEIKERLNEKSQPDKFEMLRILLIIQDATNGMNASDRELVLSMWLNGILSYDKMLDLIEQK